MSPASVASPGRAGQSGFTMIELSVAMFLIVGLTAILSASTFASRQADQYLTAVGTVTERCQKTLYDVVNIVSSSHRLFEGDDVGREYLGALDLARDPLAPGARLPVFEEERPLDVDLPDEPRTGNVLLLVREADPLPCVAEASSQTVRNIDTYRLVCVYPMQTGRQLLRGQPPAVDLVVWRSVEYPSYAQILAIEDDAQRASVVRDLVQRYGHDMAWNPRGLLAEAFYTMGVTGIVSASPQVAPRILEDVGLSSRGRLVYADVQLARTDPDSADRRAVLTVDPPATWVPNGFEVKVVGSTAGRQVWIRLVIETPAAAGQLVAVLGSTMIAYAESR